uniref:Uncharacterized protein n=1 Tax=Cacopsylla melanoneura TaxID=428564 RepID=A0A8D8RQI2_9HEMI
MVKNSWYLHNIKKGIQTSTLLFFSLFIFFGHLFSFLFQSFLFRFSLFFERFLFRFTEFILCFLIAFSFIVFVFCFFINCSLRAFTFRCRITGDFYFIQLFTVQLTFPTGRHTVFSGS